MNENLKDLISQRAALRLILCRLYDYHIDAFLFTIVADGRTNCPVITLHDPAGQLTDELKYVHNLATLIYLTLDPESMNIVADRMLTRLSACWPISYIKARKLMSDMVDIGLLTPKYYCAPDEMEICQGCIKGELSPSPELEKESRAMCWDCSVRMFIDWKQVDYIMSREWIKFPYNPKPTNQV